MAGAGKKNDPDPSRKPQPRRSRAQPSRALAAGTHADNSARDGAPSRRELRRARLINQAKKDPSLVLRDRRCLKEWFCRDFFDHCHDLALRRPVESMEFARLAVELAAKTDDRHLIHLAQGVLVHSHINREERDTAAEVLADYRASALTCCERCASDWHLRQGDLLVESVDPEGAAAALDLSVESLGPDASRDQVAYVCFSRCIQHYYAGDWEQALADAGTALRELDLNRPQGYFMDLLAFIGCFLQYLGERQHDEQALEDLRFFKQRIKGLDDWLDVRIRYAWMEGQLLGRLGRWTQAHERLRKVWRHLRKRGPHKHALAVAIDYLMLYSRRPVARSYWRMLKIIERCEEWLRLETPEREWLRIVKRCVSEQPENSADALAVFRFSFIVPVPGIMWWAWRGRELDQDPSLLAGFVSEDLISNQEGADGERGTDHGSA